MNSRPEFHPIQAEEIARVFNAEGVNYLFLGKSGAILLGYPGTTQDVDIFPERSVENGQRIVAALKRIGFEISKELERDIVSGRDFVQIKTGPFDLDLIFAPDGINSFVEAMQRKVTEGIFPVANLKDIIASKRATGRKKDAIELPMLESFRNEWEKRHPANLPSAHDVANRRATGKR